MIKIKALAKHNNKLTTFFEPIGTCYSVGEFQLNEYFGFNCWKHKDVELGCKYQLELELYNIDKKYGATYKIISLTPII